jgi:uncharacterized membrane protein YcaP (DUF421 family)
MLLSLLATQPQVTRLAGSIASWLTSPSSQLWVASAKAVLMYATALVGLRLGERRTLAQWTIIDFAAAVAIGSIVGRTAIADDQSYAVGAVALLTIIAVHRVASLLRFTPLLGKLADHRVRVLVVDGQVRRRQLRLCGLTDNDLFADLRLRGVFDLLAVRYVLYESKGGLSIVPHAPGLVPPLVSVGLQDSTGYTNAPGGQGRDR